MPARGPDNLQHPLVTPTFQRRLADAESPGDLTGREVIKHGGGAGGKLQAGPHIIVIPVQKSTTDMCEPAIQCYVSIE